MRLLDPDYLKWIRQQECSVPSCGRASGCEAHHRIGHGRRQDHANKTPDHEAIPLCPMHHDELHNHGWRAFETQHNINQLKVAISMLSKRIVYLETINGDCPI